MDLVRVQAARLDDLLHLGHRDAACHRRRRVEVACRAAKDEVAALVGLVRLDQTHIGHQRAFHHIQLAIELARLLAFGHQRADTGLGEEGGNAGAASAQLFGQRALRREFELEFTGQVLALELLVLADVAGDHLLDLPCLQQLTEAETVDAGVVGDDAEVLDAAVAQRGDQRLGNAAEAEAADSQQLAVLDDAFQRLGGTGVHLVHCNLLQGGIPAPERTT